MILPAMLAAHAVDNTENNHCFDQLASKGVYVFLINPPKVRQQKDSSTRYCCRRVFFPEFSKCWKSVIEKRRRSVIFLKM